MQFISWYTHTIPFLFSIDCREVKEEKRAECSNERGLRSSSVPLKGRYGRRPCDSKVGGSSNRVVESVGDGGEVSKEEKGREGKKEGKSHSEIKTFCR